MELIDAVIENDADTVSHLLKKGADPNFSIDGSGITPLHFAAQNNSLAVVDLLVKAGANVEAMTMPENEKPIDIAKLHGHETMVELLQKLSPKKVNVLTFHNENANKPKHTPVHH